MHVRQQVSYPTAASLPHPFLHRMQLPHCQCASSSAGFSSLVMWMYLTGCMHLDVYVWIYLSVCDYLSHVVEFFCRTAARPLSNMYDRADSPNLTGTSRNSSSYKSAQAPFQLLPSFDRRLSCLLSAWPIAPASAPSPHNEKPTLNQPGIGMRSLGVIRLAALLFR